MWARTLELRGLNPMMPLECASWAVPEGRLDHLQLPGSSALVWSAFRALPCAGGAGTLPGVLPLAPQQGLSPGHSRLLLYN